MKNVLGIVWMFMFSMPYSIDLRMLNFIIYTELWS